MNATSRDAVAAHVPDQPVITALHPGVTVEQCRGATGWAPRVAPHLEVTEPPCAGELAALRALAAA